MIRSDTRDPRVERSRTQLVDALGDLLRTHAASEVTVSALCTEAGVSRPTFYQHFATLDEVAVAGVQRIFDLIRTELPDGPDASYLLVTRFLEELDAERSVWRQAIGCGSAFAASRDAVETWFADRLAERDPEAGPTAVRYAAAGFLGVVRAWLRQDDGPGRPRPADLAAELAVVSARVLGGRTRSTLLP